MNRISGYILTGVFSIFLSMIYTSCTDLFIGPDPDADPYTVFNILWEEIDRYYPFFDVKDIDWEEVRHSYAQMVHNDMTGQDLFRELSAMVNEMRDGHLNIFTPYGTSSYTGWYDGAPTNFSKRVIEEYYVRESRSFTANGIIMYGRYRDVGYIHISTFSGTDSWPRNIDSVLKELSDTEGLILDIRDNSGGNSANSRYIASRFADREHTYSFSQYRSGPGHDEFTDLQSHVISPAGTVYTKPVALLTNRRCYSAAEDFVLAMKMFSTVVQIGDKTGGGFGNPVFRELPNGWIYRIPVWRQFTNAMENLEDIGIEPHIRIDITEADIRAGRDTIMERAYETLISRSLD
jgi:hypothetical protein